MTNKALSIVLGAILVIVLIFIWFRYGASHFLTTTTSTTTPVAATTTTKEILSFSDCVAAGYPVMESSPRQCRVPDGRVYAEEIRVEAIYKNATDEQIQVTNPAPGAVTGKTVTIVGAARGNWYFEASFPIKLLDKNGNTLASGVAHAQGDWMTTNFVPFSTSLTAPQSYIGPATLVLSKDNPSGLPENDASMSIPLTIEY